MRTSLRLLRRAFFMGMLAATTLVSPGLGENFSPSQEIESLLNYVGELHDVTFIRNGADYTAKDAEAHLRAKYRVAKSRIVTAEDFITYCATRSSLSGEEYLLRFSDGHKEPAKGVLLTQLRRLRSATRPSH